MSDLARDPAATEENYPAVRLATRLGQPKLPTESKIAEALRKGARFDRGLRHFVDLDEGHT